MSNVIQFPKPADPLDVLVAPPFTSDYLTQPLRTEDEARAQLNRPRIAPVQSPLHPLFALICAPFGGSR